MDYMHTGIERVRAPSVREYLSRYVLIPSAQVRRNFTATNRLRYRHYKDGMRFRESALSWPVERRQEWILDRLRWVVRYAFDTTPYYRALLKKIGFDPRASFTFDDYALIPPLTREAILDNSEALISNSVDRRLLKRDTTGGTSGTPTTVFLGPEESGWRESGLEFMSCRLGVLPGSRIAFLWGHHLDPGARDSWRDRWYAFQQNFCWIDCFRLSPEALSQAHAKLSRWRPAVMVCYASALVQLADFLLEAGIQPDYPTQCIITGAEKLFSSGREVVRRVFQVPTHERYGGRDVGALAIQPHPDEALDFELDWAATLVEPETPGPTNLPVLVTKLRADGMPMLRYRLGDLADFPEQAKPGHPSFVLHEIFGRETDRVWLKTGAWVSGSEMPHLMKDYPVREFTVVQREDYSVEVQVTARPGLDEKTEMQLLRVLSKNLPDLPINIRVVSQITRTKANKWRPVVSHVRPEVRSSTS